MGALRAGARNFAHFVVTGLKSRKHKDRLTKEVNKLVAKYGGKMSQTRKGKKR